MKDHNSGSLSHTRLQRVKTINNRLLKVKIHKEIKKE